MSNPFEVFSRSESIQSLPTKEGVNQFELAFGGNKEDLVGFDDMIVLYSNSSDIVLKQYVPILNYLRQTLNAQNLPQVNKILLSLKEEGDHTRISDYFSQLTAIASQYATSKNDEVDATKEDTRKVKDETGSVTEDTRRLKDDVAVSESRFLFPDGDLSHTGFRGFGDLLTRDDWGFVDDDLHQIQQLTTDEGIQHAIMSEDISGWLADGEFSMDVLNEYFDDLLVSAEGEERERLKQEIELFRKSDFNKNLENGEKYDFGDLNSGINTLADNILGQTNPPFKVEFEGFSQEYQTRREALIALYEVKRHLSEMDPYELIALLGVLGSWAGVIGAAFVASGAILFGVREKINAGVRTINEGITKDQLKALSNKTATTDGTGPLDIMIKNFRDSQVPDAQLDNLIRLQNWLSAPNIDPSAPGGETLALARDLYAQLSRFRNMKAMVFSGFTRRFALKGGTKELGINPLNPKNISNYTRYLIGSVNKGPDGFEWSTIKEVLDRYVKRCNEFNKMMVEIERMLVSAGKSPQEVGDIKKSILQLFPNKFSLGFLWSPRTNPFRDEFKKIEKILRDNAIPVSNEFEVFKRSIKGEVLPDVQKRLPIIMAFIEHHPLISDLKEAQFKYDIDILQHKSIFADFEFGCNQLIDGLGIPGVKSYGDVTSLRFRDSELLSINDIRGELRSSMKPGIPNYNKIQSYLSQTTAGHKGLIFYNICLIMEGKTPVDTLDLTLSQKILDDLSLEWSTLKDMGTNLYNNRHEVIRIGGLSPGPSGGPSGSPRLDDVQKKALRGDSHDLVMRLELEGRLQGISMVKFNSGVLRGQISKAINDNSIVDITGVHQKVEQYLIRAGITVSPGIDIKNMRFLVDILGDIETKSFDSSVSSLKARIGTLKSSLQHGSTNISGFDKLLKEIAEAFKKGHIA